ncbi:MAG: ABC transporter permease DevC [Leptolyngbyaceae bacterium]|nr:ABC transporter permease DevC [Leptolyngbyaceae bacterium]
MPKSRWSLSLPLPPLRLPPRYTLLPWFILTHDKRRLVTALGGVGFAVLLMLIFLGFKNALYDSQIQILQKLNGDIVVINKIKDSMFVPEQFARRRLYQAQAFEGVENAYCLYTATGNWRNPDTKQVLPLRILAFNPDDPVLPLPGILAQRENLKLPWTAVIDDRSRPEVGPTTPGITTELMEQQVQVIGSFSMGTDFAAGNGNVVMSDQNFIRYFARLGPEKDSRTLSTVDIGLLTVAPGTDIEAVIAVMRDRLPDDILIFSKADFALRERTYWEQNTNIGFVFGLLTSMSFVVGIILVYQILYTDVADHWAEYATLKAIGYSNIHLLVIIIQEAILLALAGFIPSVIVSTFLYHLAATATGLLMQMTVARASNIFVATIVMCLISGIMAVRKILVTDPAEVFG